LFNLFYLLSDGDSASHPNPRLRTIKIAERHFGKAVAETMLKSYDDPALLRSLFPDASKE
jgi:hypothetical protein